MSVTSIRRTVFYLTLMTIMMTWYLNLSTIEHDTQHLFKRSTADPNDHDETLPIIFVGGVGRSGTTLMRSILDAHSHVRCGRECPTIKLLLQELAMANGDDVTRLNMEDANLIQETIDAAMLKYISTQVVHHGSAAIRYCKKDPNLLIYGSYLARIFPNARFVLLIRDGRDVAQSVMLRNIPMWDTFSTVSQGLAKWDIEARVVDGECTILGPSRCFPVHYEHLVLKPRETLEALLEFLDLPWEENVLHHESLVGSKVDLTPGQPSASQVLKSINAKAVFRWTNEKESRKTNTTPTEMRKVANKSPMLMKYGYQRIQSIDDFEKLGVVNYDCRTNECRNAWFFDINR